MLWAAQHPDIAHVIHILQPRHHILSGPSIFDSQQRRVSGHRYSSHLVVFTNSPPPPPPTQIFNIAAPTCASYQT